jgi:hypothetical protein
MRLKACWGIPPNAGVLLIPETVNGVDFDDGFPLFGSDHVLAIALDMS